MLKFDISNKDELKRYLYYCQVHDSKIKGYRALWEDASFIIDSYNYIYKVGMQLQFADVKAIIVVRGEYPGDNREIVALSVEDDYSFLQHMPQMDVRSMKDCLYFCLSTFSGDELYIASKSLLIEEY